MADPQISIVIPAFNAAATIERAVLSALAEDFVGEVLVVDDASDDDTAARVRALGQQDSRAKLIALPENAGPSAARNIAIERAAGEIVGLLDADDYFLPGRIRRMMAGAADELWDFLADELLPHGTSLPGTAHGSRVVTMAHFLRHNIIKGPYLLELGFLKPLMKKSFLQRHGLRYDQALRFGEDLEFYSRALASGCSFLLLPAAGYVVVDTPMSLSKRQGLPDFVRLRESLSRVDTSSSPSAWASYFRFLDSRIAQLDLLLTPYPRRLWRAMKVAVSQPRIFARVCGMVLKDKIAWARP